MNVDGRPSGRFVASGVAGSPHTPHTPYVDGMSPQRSNPKTRARPHIAEPGAEVPPSQWLRNAAEVLDSVRHAAEDFQNAPNLSRAKTAIRNFLEQGRSVTWALAHLKSAADSPEEWDEWWNGVMATVRK
jgi:hypothetical protein